MAKKARQEGRYSYRPPHIENKVGDKNVPAPEQREETPAEAATPEAPAQEKPPTTPQAWLLRPVGNARVHSINNGNFSYRFRGRPPYAVGEADARRILRAAPELFEVDEN